MRAIMHGLKCDMTIDPKTEDHVEGASKGRQAEEQEKRGDKWPKHRYV
jgi:hypothetical protein